MRHVYDAGAAFDAVERELSRAQAWHGPMASGHEAVGVIEEEAHEFRLAVWFGVDQHGRPADPRDEAIQLAAMAIRYLIDVGHPATHQPFGVHNPDCDGPTRCRVDGCSCWCHVID